LEDFGRPERILRSDRELNLHDYFIRRGRSPPNDQSSMDLARTRDRSVWGARLTQRAMTIAQDLSAHPDQSLDSIYEGNLGWLHAAYRFYDNPAVTSAKILAPHFEATWDRSGEQPVVLIAQDTTYFNYSTHKAFQGGGPIERGAA